MRKYRDSSASILVMIVALSMSGCFTSPEASKLRCSSDDHCPLNYICVGWVPGTDTAGTCQKASLDGSSVDLASAGSSDGGPSGDVGIGSEAAAPLDSLPGRRDSSDLGADLPTDEQAASNLLPEVGADRPQLPSDPFPTPGPDLPLGSDSNDGVRPDEASTEAGTSEQFDASEPADAMSSSPDLFAPDLPSDPVEDLADVPSSSPDLPCGAVGQACCPSSSCSGSGVVCGNDGMCARCGALGQLCCAGDVCASAGNICGSAGTCVACGAEGSACCAGSRCNSADNICRSGSCVACGGPGETCCSGRICAAASNICDSNQRCVACGGLGQTCCAGSVCSDSRTVCGDSGSCVACGGLGQTCCAASACTDPAAMCDATGTCATCTSPGVVERPFVEFGPANASSAKFFRIDGTHFLVLNTVSEPIDNLNACTSWPIYATILTINPSTGATTAGVTRVLAGLNASHYRSDSFLSASLTQLDADRFLLVHGHCKTMSAMAGSVGYAEIVTFDLDHDGIALGNPTLVESSWMVGLSAAAVDASNVLIAYHGSSSGLATLITINLATGSLGKTAFASFPGVRESHRLVPLDNGRFLDVYAYGTTGYADQRTTAMVITVTLSPQPTLVLGTERILDSANYQGGSLFKIDSSNLFLVSGVSDATGRHGRAMLLQPGTGDTVRVAARSALFPVGATIDDSAAGGGPLALTHYLASFEVDGAGQMQSMSLNEIAGTITLGGVATCGAAGCPQIVATVDSTRMLGYRTTTSTKLSAGIVESHCP